MRASASVHTCVRVWVERQCVIDVSDVTCRYKPVDAHVTALPNPEGTVLGLKIVGGVPARVHNHYPACSTAASCGCHQL